MNLALGVAVNSQPRSEAYWRWKHLHNPFGKSIMLLAWRDDELVGFRALLRWRLKSQGKTINAVRAVDTVTHPDYQGQGIFSRLTLAALEECKRQDVCLVWNTPNQNSRAAYLKLGWRSQGKINMVIKPLHPLGMLVGIWGHCFGQVRSDSPAPSHTLQPNDVRDLHRPTSDGLQSEIGERYYQWRYCEVPHLQYFFYRDGDWAFIYRMNTRLGMRECVLSEILSTQPRDDTAGCSAALRGLTRTLSADYLVLAKQVQERCLAAGVWIGLGKMELIANWLIDAEPTTSSFSFSTGDLEVF
ncbi:GNAT family N-acetyltransferase [Halieaceae bacterium IMCC14734]|uniref:GNAT family N-acetyltransferase n=2 Tax=Candidatus Litorirhabdus singularis TaxID=2518993 RepID=A0ABT3TET0_9GAMM|nr:GNAT family N-acetyltransferase [Candidatus Litorirhabdus singularis]